MLILFKKLVCFQLQHGKEYHTMQITLIANFIPVVLTMEQVQLKGMALLKEQLLGQIGLYVAIHLQSTIIWNWVGLSMIKMVD